MPIQPGTDIGRYHILEQLGEGGMAVVYKAYDTRLENEVAIKFIRMEEFGSRHADKMLKRFQIEARNMARLTHQNIVKVMDYGEFEGNPYLVMPYLPGGTLKQMLGKPIPWQKALQLILPISRALGYAHKQGVIHRDVKPSNILITEEGDPMLSDFGIAKILEGEDGQTLTTTGMGMGTPEYMSPEQAEGKKVDARSDIYSLGIILFELVTGKKPFTADTPMAVIVKQLHDPLPPLLDNVVELPQAIKQVIYKCMSKKPVDRYADIPALTRALERPLAGKEKIIRKPEAVKPEPVFKVEPTVDALEQNQPSFRYEEHNVESKAEAPRNDGNTSWIYWVLGIIMFGLLLAIIGLSSPRETAAKPVFEHSLDGTQIHDTALAKVYSTYTAYATQNYQTAVAENLWSTAYAATKTSYNLPTMNRTPINSMNISLLVSQDEDSVTCSNNLTYQENFSFEAVFTNPSDISKGWNYGILFRHAGGNEQYRLILHNEGMWEISWGYNETIYGLTNSSAIKRGANQENKILLDVSGTKGKLFINDRFEKDLLLDKDFSGYIIVCTDLYANSGKKGNIIKVRDIKFSSLD